jgi:hypothetical protein
MFLQNVPNGLAPLVPTSGPRSLCRKLADVRFLQFDRPVLGMPTGSNGSNSDFAGVAVVLKVMREPGLRLEAKAP